MPHPWHKLTEWNPFKIDALGLVTLLGAEEINQSLGRLVPSRYLEYFPLLGAFVIAGERFKEKKASFNLYNISDGIHNTSDLSFWLTRWMSEQEFEITRSVVHFEVPDEPLSWTKWHIVSASLSFGFTGFLVAGTILIGDWYGLANAIAMIVGILCRAYSMQAHRNAIDRSVEKAIHAAANTPPAEKFVPDRKCIMITADARAVTIFLPRGIIVPVFSYNPEPMDPWAYHLIRYVGWAAFGIHILTIGMATLAPQIYTVVLIVLPTVLICWKLGCDDSKWHIKYQHRVLGMPHKPTQYWCWIGTRLKAYVSEWPQDLEFQKEDPDVETTKATWKRRFDEPQMDPDHRSKRRQDLYAWLNLTPDEEDSLAKWDLLPHQRGDNKSWWDDYQDKKALVQAKPPKMMRKHNPDGSFPDSDSESAHDSGDDSDDPSKFTRAAKGGAQVTMNGDTSTGVGKPPKRSNTWLTSNGFVANHPHAAVTSPTSTLVAPSLPSSRSPSQQRLVGSSSKQS